MMVMAINLISQLTFLMKIIIKFNRHFLVCTLLLPLISCAFSGDSSTDSLVIDKSVRRGKLQNGFTYYLKSLADIDEISLKFYVKVGNLNEQLMETDFAHLIEHLGYQEGYCKSYYSELPTTFINSEHTTSASTSQKHTLYWSIVKRNDSNSLENRLEWFYNITNMDLEDSVVLREARCVRQETFYKGEGFELNRFFNKSKRDAAILFNSNGETPYTNWLTHYDMGGISIPSFREFYHNWYRPDRMALVITGDIQDIDTLEQQIIALYSKIPKEATKNDKFDKRFFYLNSPPKFKTVERNELNRFSDWNNKNSKISLFYRVKNFDSYLDAKEKWINEKLYMAMYGMIYQRLREKGVTSWNSKKGSVIDIQLPDRNRPYLRLPEIESKPRTERKNLQRVTCILQQLKKNGFTQKEWDMQKSWILKSFSSKDTTRIGYWEDQLKKHFVYGEILPVNKKAITTQWIESLSLEDINSYLKENFSVMPDDIYITASAGHPALSFTERQVRGWMNDAIKQPIELKEATDITHLTPVDKKNPALMDPKRVRELKKKDYKELGINPDTELDVLEFDNGVKVILDCQEPSTNVSEMISIIGTSPRGASYFPADKYYSAISAPEIVKLSGVGGYSRKTIRNKLGGEFRPSEEPVQLHIKNNNSTVSARAKFEEFEKYLQLIYLYFSSPQKDTTAFTHWQSQIKDQYFGKIYGGVSSRIDLKKAIARLLNFSDFAPSNQISTDLFYQKQNVNLVKALECYKNIFGNASDFTFIIKGRYDKMKVMPLLQKYLGNLPSDKDAIKANCSALKEIKKTDIKLSQGPIYNTFYADKIKAGYKLYTVPFMLTYIFPITEKNWKDQVVLNMISTYLGPKIDQELRFIKGASVYYETVEGRYSKVNSLYSLAIFVDTLDDELDLIRKETKNMVTELRYNGISKEEKKVVLENPLFVGRYTSTPKLQEKVMRYAHSLTSEDFKKVASKYFKENYQYEFVYRESMDDLIVH